MAPTIDPRAARTPAFLHATRLLIALGMSVVAWLAACQRLPEARQPAAAPVAPATARHANGKVQFDLLAKLLADDRRDTQAADWLEELAAPMAPYRVATQRHPLLGQTAPDFTLHDHQ